MVNKITLYHAVWCGHCVNFQPEWEKLKQLAKEKNIKTESYEAEQDKDVMQKDGIRAFPTIMLQINDDKIEYVGERTADKIMDKFDEIVGNMWEESKEKKNSGEKVGKFEEERNFKFTSSGGKRSGRDINNLEEYNEYKKLKYQYKLRRLTSP